jgi:hypothetical protein
MHLFGRTDARTPGIGEAKFAELVESIDHRLLRMDAHAAFW